MTTPLKTLPARMLKTATWISAAMLISAALVIGIGRELVRNVEHFQSPLQAWLSQKTGLSLHFERVRGVWEGTSPEFYFDNIVIENPEVPAATPIKINRLEAKLSIGQSLLTLSPRVRLRVLGAEIRISKQEAFFTLLGKPLKRQEGGSKTNPIGLLLNKPRIAFYNSRVFLEGLYDRRTDVRIHQLRLFWSKNRALTEGDITLTGPDEMRLSVRSDLGVTRREGGQVQGVTYVLLTQGQLSHWITPEIAEKLPVKIQGLRGKFETWLHWSSNTLDSATVRFDWRDAQLSNQQDQTFSLKKIAGTARWQGDVAKQWQLALRDLQLTTDEASWRPTSLIVNASHEAAADIWRYKAAMADAAFLSGVQPLLLWLPSDSRLREALTTLQPSGRLQDVMLEVHRDQQRWHLDKGRGVLRNFTMRPWEKTPGVGNVGAAFWYEDSTLWVDFNEQNLILDYPALFRGPLDISTLRGSLVARWDDEKLQVRSSPLLITTPHGRLAGRMNLFLPKVDTLGPPTLALQLTVRDVEAQYASRYLPAGVITENLLAWLDNGLKGGRLLRGDILLNGPLHRPEQEAAKSILLGFQVEDGSLQFLPDWQEPIRHLNADVIVENGKLKAHAQGGEYYGLALDNSEVWTERVGVAQVPHLYVKAQGKGEAENGLRLLRESPLGKFLSEPLSDMKLQGPLEAVLKLDVPLAPGNKLAGQAIVSVKQSAMEWPSKRLNVEKLDLNLTYDMQKGLTTQRMRGNTLQGAINGRLHNVQEKGRRITRLDLQGTASMAAVRDWLQIPALGLASGMLPYQLQFYFRPAGGPMSSEMLLNSSLEGVQVDLPAPFAKPAEAQRPLTLQYTLAGEARRHRLSYGSQVYGSPVNVLWETRDGRIAKGSIALGEEDAHFSPDHAWRLTGSLDTLRQSDWTPTLDKLKAMSKGHSERLPGLTQLGEFGDSQLKVAHLYLGEDDLQQATLTLDSDAQFVTLQADGARLQGRLMVPRPYLASPASRSQETPVALYLQKLVLTDKTPKDEVVEEPPIVDALPPPESIDPRLLPAAHVRIDQLLSGTKDMGSYNMTLVPIPEGVNVENLRFTLKAVDFTGTARWERDGNYAYTALRGKGTTKNVADVLAGWNYTPSLDSESGTVELDLRWMGAPYQFALARTEGSLRTDLHNGHFLKVGNSAAGRVWGLLNFETWMSRLQLHFDDLSDSEMTYKDIHGRFVLQNNQIKVERLKIDSVSLRMKMDGMVDMRGRQLNMQWYVTLPVTRNLMLPAVVAGGLPGAATVFVIDKVLGKQIDKLTTLTYDVTGTFDEPQAKVRIPL